jgi:hypothetical protein
MAMLYTHSSKAKYTMELMRYLAHQIALWSNKQGKLIFYRSFVNTSGGLDTSVPNDLAMEYLVKEYKRAIKHMHSGKTDRNVDRHSAGLSGISDVSKQYDSVSKTIVRCTTHKRQSSDFDELEIISDLRSVRPFSFVMGRQNIGIRVNRSSFAGIQLNEFLQWISRKQLLYTREIGN